MESRSTDVVVSLTANYPKPQTRLRPHQPAGRGGRHRRRHRAVTVSNDRTAIVWDLATGTVLHTLTGHQDSVRAVAVTSDDTRVVTTSVDGTAIARDLASGARYRSLTGHQRPIQAVAMSATSRPAVGSTCSRPA
jgi:WD40 repeat protein